MTGAGARAGGGEVVKRVVSTLLIKMSNALKNLSWWLEFDLLAGIQYAIDVRAIRLTRRAAELWPDNFCPHCNRVIELCYHDGLTHKGKPFYSCCNCGGYIKPREARDG